MRNQSICVHESFSTQLYSRLTCITITEVTAMQATFMPWKIHDGFGQ
jgi:hypothetical protein